MQSDEKNVYAKFDNYQNTNKKLSENYMKKKCFDIVYIFQLLLNFNKNDIGTCGIIIILNSIIFFLEI